MEDRHKSLEKNKELLKKLAYMCLIHVISVVMKQC